MRNSNCAVCAAPSFPTRHGGTACSECSACGYAQLDEFSARRDYWPQDVSAHEIDEYWTGAKHHYFASALNLLSGMARGRRLLDFGGGIGYFSDLALRSGWDAYSLDVSSQASEMAVARIGRERVFENSLHIDTGSFDVITLWCVLAHVPDPHDLIREVTPLLVDGGIIWITTPNYRFQKTYSKLRQRIGRPVDFTAEDHIGHFTLEAIEQLLYLNRFSDVEAHFAGITERCIVAGSDARPAVALKRAYNRIASGFARRGRANYLSELQVTATLRDRANTRSAPQAPHEPS